MISVCCDEMWGKSYENIFKFVDKYGFNKMSLGAVCLFALKQLFSIDEFTFDIIA